MTTSTTSTTTSTPLPTQQVFHHLVAVNIRTRISYAPNILNTEEYRVTCAKIRRNMMQLSLERNPAWGIRTFMPLGPVLDGVHKLEGCTSRGPGVGGVYQSQAYTWIRLKIELLMSSRHRTPEEAIRCLHEVLYHKLDRSCLDYSPLPVTGYTLYARTIKSLTGTDANEAIARITAAEDLQRSISASCLLASTLPAKREIGFFELIMSPLALHQR